MNVCLKCQGNPSEIIRLEPKWATDTAFAPTPTQIVLIFDTLDRTGLQKTFDVR